MAFRFEVKRVQNNWGIFLNGVCVEGGFSSRYAAIAYMQREYTCRLGCEKRAYAGKCSQCRADADGGLQ